MVSYVAGAFSASMFLSVLFRAITPCGAHNPEGFISIDCGSPRTDYLDPSTNLTWTGDGSHMLTGKNGVIPITTAVPSFFPNREALKDFRYFPPGRNKHCYELPLTGNSTTFLIRAMFFHSSSSVLSQRTRFQIYVNATKWVNVQYGVDGDDDFRLSYPEIREGIFYKYPGAYTENVCLVPEFGIPFISSLELRELDHEGMMYSDNMVDTWSRQRLFLTKLWRRNLVPYDLWGNESTHLDNWASILRYPDDHFDRIWDPMPIRDNNSERVSNPNVSQVRLKLLNNLPPKTVESGEYLTALWNGFGNFYPDRISGGTVCFIFYFHSNQSSQKSPTIVRFSAGDQNMEWNDTNELSMTSIASFQRGGSQSIAIAGTYNSSLDLLAYEGYYADQYTMDRTALPDCNGICELHEKDFNMSDWQGDPCLPTPYNFIECSSDIYLSPSYSWLTSLLGGNPICENPEKLFHRYLCRSSITDKSYEAENHEDNNTRLLKWLIPASVLGGFVIFGLSAGTIFLYRRLKRQEMENLRQKRMLEQMQKKQAELERKFRPLIFLYDELKRATNEFSKELGRGGFGIVYEGILQHGTKVAVKVLNNKVLEEDEKQLEKDFVTEVSNVCGISHTNVAQLLGYCYNDRKRIIIYELVEGGDLAQALWGHKNQNTTLQWKERLRICAGVAKGLAYLHEGLNSPGVIHRDIKPSNILLGRNLNPKIADFGLAQATWEMGTAAPVTHLRGTLPYAAREYVERRILTEKYDVYSFGVVALEIISGRKCEDPNQDDPAKFFLKKWAQTLQNKGNLVGLLPSELKETSPLDQVESVIKIALSCLEEDDYTRRPKMSKVQCMLEDLMPPDVPSGSAHKKMPMGRAGGTADENSTASQRTWTHSPDVPSGSSSALELLPMGRAGGTAADKNSTPSPRTGIPSSPRFEFPFSSGRSDAVVKGTEEEGLLTSFSGVEISLASGGTA